MNQARILTNLAYVLCDDEQFDAAEEAASHAINLLPEKGEQYRVCQGHRALGNIYQSKGNTERAVHHFEVAIEIASSLNLDNELFWLNYSLSKLSSEGRLDDAHAQIERAKLHAVNDTYLLAWASQLQAVFWNKQRMFEEAKSEALRALGMFEKLGATNDAENTRNLLGWIDRSAQGMGLAIPDESADDGEFLETMLLVVCIDFVFGRDHRSLPRVFKLQASDMTLSQATNASPLHLVSR